MPRGLFRHPPQPRTTNQPFRPRSVYESVILGDNPVGYWRLDETTGTVAGDMSGNGHTGTYTNTPTLGATGLIYASGTAGDANLAATFSTTGPQYVQVTGGAWLGTSAASIECWADVPSSASNRGIIGFRTAADAANAFYIMQLSSGVYEARIRMSDGVNRDINAAVVPGVRHLVLTFDQAFLRFYIDGVEAGNISASTALGGTMPNFRIGSEGENNYFNGTIDEAAYYSTTLTPTQVLAHYDAWKSSGASVTASDTFATTDAVTRALTLGRTASDSIATTDSVARVATLLRTAADSLGITESVARILTLGRTAADSVSVGNTVARIVTLARTASDSLGISEAVTRTATLLRTASDSLTIAESVSQLKLIIRTLSDSLTVGDAVTRLVTLARTAADSIATTDAVARVLTLNRTNADSVTISESVTGQVSHGSQNLTRTADDSLTVSDAATRALTLGRTAADGVTVSESVAQLTASFATAADTVSVGNAATRQVTLGRTAADSVTISDSASVTINGTPIVPTGGAHKGPTFIGRLPERERRRREERIRVPVALSMEVRDAVRFRTSVSAVVEFTDDEDAIELLVLAGAL